MYLHLGMNVVVPEATIIGVFDLDNTTGSHITRKFLNEAEKAGRVISVSDELPRSFIVCCDEYSNRSYTAGGATRSRSRAQQETGTSGKARKNGASEEKDDEKVENNDMKVYLSQLSSQTLFKRSESEIT